MKQSVEWVEEGVKNQEVYLEILHKRKERLETEIETLSREIASTKALLEYAKKIKSKWITIKEYGL